jgi:hypothetical protein
MASQIFSRSLRSGGAAEKIGCGSGGIAETIRCGATGPAGCSRSSEHAVRQAGKQRSWRRRRRGNAHGFRGIEVRRRRRGVPIAHRWVAAGEDATVNGRRWSRTGPFRVIFPCRKEFSFALLCWPSLSLSWIQHNLCWANRDRHVDPIE